MFDVTVRNLARAFVSAAQVEAKASTYADLLQRLGDDFLPRPIAELRPTGATVQRLGAATATGEWSVHLTSESVDVTYLPKFGNNGIPFPEFCARAARYLQSAHAMVGQQAHRVALVREGLDGLTVEQLDVLGSRLLVRASPFNTTLFEWDWRAAVKIPRTFGSHTEETNTIGIFKRVEVAPPGKEPEDRLWVATDVNTPPQQLRPRFSPEDSAAFVNAGASWHAELEVALQILVEGN